MNQSVLTEKLLGHATVNVFFTASVSSLSICICFFLGFFVVLWLFPVILGCGMAFQYGC